MAIITIPGCYYGTCPKLANLELDPDWFIGSETDKGEVFLKGNVKNTGCVPALKSKIMVSIIKENQVLECHQKKLGKIDPGEIKPVVIILEKVKWGDDITVHTDFYWEEK
jgi:hypothetical protein